MDFDLKMIRFIYFCCTVYSIIQRTLSQVLLQYTFLPFFFCQILCHRHTFGKSICPISVSSKIYFLRLHIQWFNIFGTSDLLSMWSWQAHIHSDTYYLWKPLTDSNFCHVLNWRCLILVVNQVVINRQKKRPLHFQEECINMSNKDVTEIFFNIHITIICACLCTCLENVLSLNTSLHSVPLQYGPLSQLSDLMS